MRFEGYFRCCLLLGHLKIEVHMDGMEHEWKEWFIFHTRVRYVRRDMEAADQAAVWREREGLCLAAFTERKLDGEAPWTW